MKILIQMGDPYPDESPCAKRIRTIYEAFSKCGDEAIVLAPGQAPDSGSLYGAVYCPTVPLRKKSNLYRFLNSAVFALTSYIKAVRIKNIDIVITTCPPPIINLSGLMIARVHRAEFIYDVRDLWPDVAWEMGSLTRGSLYSRIFEWIRNLMLSNAGMVLAVSEGKADKLRRYAPDRTVVEIKNGLDEEFLQNEPDQELINRYGLAQKMTVCYIGNLGHAQGLKQLLTIAERAVDEMPETQFLLFGSGAEEAELKKYVRDNGLSNVRFPGRIPNRQIYTILTGSDICFVSLVNEKLKDSVPTKIYEALGAGCPVLLAAEGDAAKVVADSEFGMVVKPNDTEALWNAFVKMSSDLEKYRRRKDAVRAYVLKHYSRQKEADRLVEILHRGYEKESTVCCTGK